MNPHVEELRRDWEKFHQKLRLPQNDFHPACDNCKLDACCYEPVFADAFEVDDILSRLTPGQLIALKLDVWKWHERAKHMFTLGRENIAFTWRDARVPCPFLHEGRCGIYEIRPLACRAHYALHNPELCKMPHRREQKYLMLDHDETYQMIALKYAVGIRRLLADHFGLILYNRLFQRNEESASAEGYEVAEETKI